MILKDEDPQIFERFNIWLYQGRLLKEGETARDVSWNTSFGIFIFAEKFGSHRLQNATTDHMIRMNAAVKIVPCGKDVSHAWNATSASSPLKRYLVDIYTRKADLPTILGSGAKYGEFHVEFMVGIALAFHKIKRDGSMYQGFEWWKERCRWHVHEVADPVCV